MQVGQTEIYRESKIPDFEDMVGKKKKSVKYSIDILCCVLTW